MNNIASIAFTPSIIPRRRNQPIIAERQPNPYTPLVDALKNKNFDSSFKEEVPYGGTRTLFVRITGPESEKSNQGQILIVDKSVKPEVILASEVFTRESQVLASIDRIAPKAMAALKDQD